MPLIFYTAAVPIKLPYLPMAIPHFWEVTIILSIICILMVLEQPHSFSIFLNADQSLVSNIELHQNCSEGSMKAHLKAQC